MKTAFLICLGFIGLNWTVGISSAQTNGALPTTQNTRNVAIFVKNHADNVPDQKVSALEDLITSHVTGQGYRVISRDDALNAVAGFANAGPNQGDPSLAGASLDKLMSNNTSALRLAQNLGADYILMAAIDSFTTDNIQYDEGDVHTSITVYKLVLTYKLLDGGAGSISSDNVTAEKKERTQPGLQISHSDIIGDLMTDAAGKLSDKIAANLPPPPPPVADDMVQFNVITTMADVIVPITTRMDNGDYSVSTNASVQIPATVELDGIARGRRWDRCRGTRGFTRSGSPRPDSRTTWKPSIFTRVNSSTWRFSLMMRDISAGMRARRFCRI